MTAIELFKKITSEPKWYAGYCSAQNATNIKRRFEAKQLTFDKLQHLFNHFGFFLEAEWVEKKTDKCGYRP